MNNNKKSIFCTGSCTVVQKKSVSRICAPVKMQINLFVRSMGFVFASLGVDGLRRASPLASPQCAAVRCWAPSQNQWDWSLPSAGDRTSAVAKCPAASSSCWDWFHFSKAQCSDQFVFNPGQDMRRNAWFLHKLWQWTYASVRAQAMWDDSWLWSCSTQRCRRFRAWSSVT